MGSEGRYGTGENERCHPSSGISSLAFHTSAGLGAPSSCFAQTFYTWHRCFLQLRFAISISGLLAVMPLLPMGSLSHQRSSLAMEMRGERKKRIVQADRTGKGTGAVEGLGRGM